MLLRLFNQEAEDGQLPKPKKVVGKLKCYASTYPLSVREKIEWDSTVVADGAANRFVIVCKKSRH